MIALASATGAHIFRHSKRRGDSLKEHTSSSATSSSHEGTVKAAPPTVVSGTEALLQQHQQMGLSRPSADSGLDLGVAAASGFSNVSPCGTNAYNWICHPQRDSSLDFPMPSPLGKRHSLTVMEPMLPVPNLSGSTSLLVLPQNDAVQAQPPKPQQQPNGRVESRADTVELKTHLKEREKISVAKEKRAAKTVGQKQYNF